MRFRSYSLGFGDSIFINSKPFLVADKSEHLYHIKLTLLPNSGYPLPNVTDVNSGNRREIKTPYHLKIGEVLEFDSGMTIMMTRFSGKDFRLSIQAPYELPISRIKLKR